MWWRRLPTTDGLGEVRDGSAEHPPAEEDEGVDRDRMEWEMRHRSALRKPKDTTVMSTVYLTVYDGLSSW